MSWFLTPGINDQKNFWCRFQALSSHYQWRGDLTNLLIVIMIQKRKRLHMPRARHAYKFSTSNTWYPRCKKIPFFSFFFPSWVTASYRGSFDLDSEFSNDNLRPCLRAQRSHPCRGSSGIWHYRENDQEKHPDPYLNEENLWARKFGYLKTDSI